MVLQHLFASRLKGVLHHNGLTLPPTWRTGCDHECVVCMSKPTLGPVRKWGNVRNYSE